MLDSSQANNPFSSEQEIILGHRIEDMEPNRSVKLIVALLLDEATTSSCQRFSEDIAQLYDSEIVLGYNSLAHVTVLHTECDTTDVEHLWSVCKKYMKRKYLIELAGLTLIPTNDQQIWLQIQVLKYAWLLWLQQSLLSDDIFRNKRIYSSIEDKFRPHITVALVKGAIDKSLPLPNVLLTKSDVVAIPSLGLMGENGTYTHPLFLLI